MMKNSDKPAYPIELSGFGLYAPEAHYGLTKREIFAMVAMQGILTSETEDWRHKEKESLASAAVEYADALLKELEK